MDSEMYAQLSVEEPKPFDVSCHQDTDDESEECRPPTLDTPVDPPKRPAHRVRRREVEARRYNGREDVQDYLLQFELTARRNGWDDEEKSLALLCALEGAARGILSEFDSPTTATYVDVKHALLRRFGPTQLVEVHEQTLSQLRLAKGQSIRELAHKVQRLVKQAYPDIIGMPRERLAAKHLIAAIPDKDIVFYIRDKNPTDISEACRLYERYTALSEHDSHKKPGVKGITDPQVDPKLAEPSHLQRQVTEAIERMTTATNQQLQKLTEVMSQLQPPRAPAPPALAPPSMPPVSLAQPPPPAPAPVVPRAPCPRCGLKGHWARDCTQPPRRFPDSAPARTPPPATGGPHAPQSHAASNALCFRCGQPGHRQRDCPLNPYGPAPAPSVGPRLQQP